MAALEQGFYRRHALIVARELLGRELWRRLPDGTLLGGRIVETEAYTPEDPSCHAHKGTSVRARSMFLAGGISYVYLIYGMYHCLNLVAQEAGEGAAVLIRALEPLGELAERAQQASRPRDIARGPGRLCRALDIDRRLDGVPVDSVAGPLWVAGGAAVADSDVLQTPRIGINASPAAIAAPWRLIVAGSAAVSGTRAQNSGAKYDPRPDWFTTNPV